MKTMWRVTPNNEKLGQWAAMYVTMNRKGHIVMNRRTYESVGSPEAFLLMYDPPTKRIGLKPVELNEPDAYRACPSGRHGGKLVRGYRLIQENGVEVLETIQFHDAKIDNDILILDLKTARVSTRARGRRGNEA
jgi:hypothetical protein